MRGLQRVAVGRGLERQAGVVGQRARKGRGKAVRRVQPGADCGAALRHRHGAQHGLLQPRLRIGDLRHVARELLAQRQRHRVLQVRAPDLDDIGEGFDLARKGLLQLLQRRQQLLLDRARRGNVHRGREAVVARLAGIDVVVRMHRLLAADLAAEQLDRAVGDDLVEVHVGLRARSGLPDRQRKLLRPAAFDHFRGRLLDGVRQLGREYAQLTVGAGRAQLQDGKGLDQRGRHLLVADAEVLARAFGLRAPKMIGGHGDAAQAVFLDAGVAGGRGGHGQTPLQGKGRRCGRRNCRMEGTWRNAGAGKPCRQKPGRAPAVRAVRQITPQARCVRSSPCCPPGQPACATWVRRGGPGCGYAVILRHCSIQTAQARAHSWQCSASWRSHSSLHHLQTSAQSSQTSGANSLLRSM
ncbi:hypothetical protein D9M70_321760 [compost metagenome]